MFVFYTSKSVIRAWANAS